MSVCPGQRRPDGIGVKTYLHYSWFVGLGIQFLSDRSDDPVLIKCVIHGGSDMGAMDPPGGNQRWENVDRSDL